MVVASNPFQPAEQVAPKVKALVYGASGVGKTFLALTAPGPIAVIDTEGGTAFYASRVGKGGLSAFDVLPTKTFAQVEQAVAYLRDNPGHYQTLVVDPVTVLYETLQDAAQHRRAEVRRDTEADLEMLDWQRIKRAYKRLMTDLVNLPVHVIVTAREGELSEERPNGRGRTERVRIGFKPDAEKSTAYYFDTVIRLVPSPKGREGIAEKDRTGVHALNARTLNPTFDRMFGKALGVAGTAERALQSDDEAIRIDAATTMATEELHDREETVTPLGQITRTGVIGKGDGLRSDLQPRLQVDGYLIGFLLEVGDGKPRPQVVAQGPLGKALFDATDGNPESLNGRRVTIEGELSEVQRAGRRKLWRISLTRIVTDEWRLPDTPDEPTDMARADAVTEATEVPAPTGATESAPPAQDAPDEPDGFAAAWGGPLDQPR